MGQKAADAHLKNHPGDKLGPCTPPPVGCPCAENGDSIWIDASAMKAYWISKSYFSDWSCVKDTETLQATFLGIYDYCYPLGPSSIEPTVLNGACQGSNGITLTVTAAQAQACIQQMETLGAGLDTPITCVEQSSEF